MILRWFQPPHYYWYHFCFFTFHVRCISVAKSSYFRIISAYYYYYYYYYIVIVDIDVPT